MQTPCISSKLQFFKLKNKLWVCSWTVREDTQALNSIKKRSFFVTVAFRCIIRDIMFNFDKSDKNFDKNKLISINDLQGKKWMLDGVLKSISLSAIIINNILCCDSVKLYVAKIRNYSRCFPLCQPGVIIKAFESLQVAKKYRTGSLSWWTSMEWMEFLSRNLQHGKYVSNASVFNTSSSSASTSLLDYWTIWISECRFL